jgi:tRNA wybutosine-synthesizing protein 4
MDFMSKNFQYVTKPFGEFMEAVDTGKRLYLRSLSAEKPSELPADLDRDFPTIANDFQLPPELKLVGEKAHSSALRISGPVNMWLHYDVGSSRYCPNFSSNRGTGNG